uniref:N-acetylgalactosaminide beta-1,3-galactosyltransferase n=1 Tax=Rhabditophanes sp. KR3021 TaxID=114890 RepID=A0AC35TZJ3_9BILA
MVPTNNNTFAADKELNETLKFNEMSQINTSTTSHFPRIFCFILTCPQNHKTKAVHVAATWAKHCDNHIFVSTQHDPTLPTIVANLAESRKFLWGKTKFALSYIYQHYYHKYDYFVKMDDDSFLIVESLKHFLKNKNVYDPVWYGFQMKTFAEPLNTKYMSGGAGYVISKRALKVIAKYGLNDSTKCRSGNEGNEDVEIGVCFAKVGVKRGDSRDESQKELFFPQSPDIFVPPIMSKEFKVYKERSVFGLEEPGTKTMPLKPISFHYIKPRMMYVLHYLIYDIQVPKSKRNT